MFLFYGGWTIENEKISNEAACGSDGNGVGGADNGTER